jgi:hypothetical protein
MAGRLLARVRVHDVIMAAEPWDGSGRKKKRGWRLVTLTCPVSTNADDNFRRGQLRSGVIGVRRALSKFWRLTDWGRQVANPVPLVDADGQPVYYVRGPKAGTQRVSLKKRARRDTSAVAFLEIGPANGMPHAHLLIYGEYVPHEAIEQAWGRALGRRAWVDVRAVADIGEGLQEVVKYVAKGSKDLEVIAPRAAAVELAFRHVHRGSVVGALRKIKADKDDAPDSIDLTPEDVHATKQAACEDCGCIGEWAWMGVTAADTVGLNGGFGLIRTAEARAALTELPAGLRLPDGDPPPWPFPLAEFGTLRQILLTGT